jgi:hypothetical protein
MNSGYKRYLLHDQATKEQGYSNPPKPTKTEKIHRYNRETTKSPTTVATVEKIDDGETRGGLIEALEAV